MTNNSIRFRLAEPPDAAAIRDIVRAAYAKWVPVIGREPLPMRADYEKAVAEHPLDLAVADGHIVGMIETIPAEDHLWIENVCVAPHAQGRGIGRLLLERAERKALEASHSEIRLLTNGAFEANVSLYKKHGFVIDREEPFMGGMTIYMSKKLPR
jgi:GNAT superfamily N-acetyltransferase